MNTFEITPSVDETQEFIEIANDFSNSLDLVREAISNAYDAGANEISIDFDVINECGESVLKITISDNGSGMSQEELKAFFDLGNSSRRGDPNTIGEKGHGTKVYFNSKKIEVKTTKDGTTCCAVMDDPFRKLHNREIPTVNVRIFQEKDGQSGTAINIYGYNHNRREKFTHSQLKDYIMWLTKHGAVENMFYPEKYGGTILKLKGLGEKEPELLPWGHVFPEDSLAIEELFEKHLTEAPYYYSKRIIKKGHLKNHPEIEYHAIFCIEGKRVKYDYNPMLRRRGYNAPPGAYTIQDRYGIWICKDFIPIQRKNEWITQKGSEFTKLHAFFNCQGVKLTANRGSIENTPSEILQDIQGEVRRIYEDMIKSDDWTSMEWLEEEAVSYQTTEKEKKNFSWRVKKINKANIAEYKGITLVEPEKESGVFSLCLLLSTIAPKLFPFQIVDYDTHEGIDVIAKGDHETPIVNAKLFYVEFKRTLNKKFNHSFENLHSVVCWNTDIKHDDTVDDINGEERKMEIVAPEKDHNYTTYFLTHPKKAHRIEVFVLRDYLKEKLGLEFRPRTKDSLV